MDLITSQKWKFEIPLDWNEIDRGYVRHPSKVSNFEQVKLFYVICRVLVGYTSLTRVSVWSFSLTWLLMWSAFFIYVLVG